MAIDRITMRFAGKILREEWKEFEEAQDRVIRMRTNRVTGTLRNEHGDRRYSVSGDDLEVTGKLIHPDYERYLDMKKDRMVTRRFAKVFTDNDRLTRKRGRNIHNKIIFGRLNPITFRLMHELRMQVIEEVKGRGRG